MEPLIWAFASCPTMFFYPVFYPPVAGDGPSRLFVDPLSPFAWCPRIPSLSLPPLFPPFVTRFISAPPPHPLFVLREFAWETKTKKEWIHGDGERAVPQERKFFHWEALPLPTTPTLPFTSAFCTNFSPCVKGKEEKKVTVRCLFYS